MKLFFSRQFILFLLVGGSAAAVNFSIRFLFDDFMSYGLAVICSYLTGMVLAFLLMRFIVFEKTGKGLHKEFFFFIMVNIIAIFLTWGVSVSLAEYVFPSLGKITFRYEIAHAIGIIIPAFTSYFGHKKFTFHSLVD
jgi:putative flippase GtrA